MIGGYKQLFYNPMTRQYLSGTTFEDILSLYYFDKSLRELVFKYLCLIEQNLRSLISYHFSETYSPNESDYLNTANYNFSHKNASGIKKLIQMLTIEAHSNTNHPYIVYQRATYNNIPLWVMVNTLTFGQLSKMYSFLKTGTQSKISRLDIPDTILHKKLGIPQSGSQYTQGKSDLFSVVIAFRYLLSQNDFLAFKHELTLTIAKVTRQGHTLTESKLLEAMGFPANWKNISRYKL